MRFEKKNSKLLLWGKKIQSPKFTAVSASKTLLILANGTSSLIVHGWVFIRVGEIYLGSQESCSFWAPCVEKKISTIFVVLY